MLNDEMKSYTGTKTVLAKPMSRAEYTTYRGWKLPSDEDGSDAGMLVEYTDGGKANHPSHSGYISWSPIDVFNRAYSLDVNSTYVERLQRESEELTDKLNKLSVFISGAVFSKLSDEKQLLLMRQQSIMETYLSVLCQRTALEEVIIP